MYSVMFSVCDQFNRDLNDHTWPHRTGGGIRAGTAGANNNFHISSILLNTFNAYTCVHSTTEGTYSYKQFVLELAEELYEYANDLEV